MIAKKVYVMGTHLDSFRPGEPAEIIGVKMVKPSDNLDFRICYQVEYGDGFVDYIAVSDTESSHKTLTISDMINSKITLKDLEETK